MNIEPEPMTNEPQPSLPIPPSQPVPPHPPHLPPKFVPTVAVAKFLEEAALQKKERLDPRTAEALKKIDQQTLYSCASVVSQVGFSHFDLSRDTRLQIEARKAHRFVAQNCEDLTRKILRLSGVSETQVQGQMNAIAEHVVNYRKLEAEKKASKDRESKEP